jgi:hypothetical protein
LPATVNEDRAAGCELTVRGSLLLVTAAALVLDRFTIPFGPSDLPPNLAITLTVLGFLALLGRLAVSPARLIGFLSFAATICVVSALGEKITFSTSSLALLFLLYGCFVFDVPQAFTGRMLILKDVQALILVVAIAAIAQFLLQFVFKGSALFTFSGLLPESLLVKGFNTVIPLWYGSTIYKSNGFVLTEPSYLSQLMALGLIVEIRYFGRWARIGCFGAALLLSFSGTGLLVLIAIAPLLVRNLNWRSIAVAAAVIVVVCVAVGPDLVLESYGTRMGEFAEQGSSFNDRFIEPLAMIAKELGSNPTALLVGLGPGAVTDIKAAYFPHAHDPTWAKLLIEYGLIGSVAFCILMVTSLWRHAEDRALALAFAIGYLCFGGMLLHTRYQALVLVLGVLTNTRSGWRGVASEDAGRVMRFRLASMRR